MAVHKWEKRPTANFGDVWTPVANVQLRSLANQFHSFAFQIDSGAVISLLKRLVADILGIDLTSGRRVQLTSVGGGGTSAFVHTLVARFEVNTECDVPFAIAETEMVPNLLGRLGFFDRMRIDFDALVHETIITLPRTR
jgi:Aspartyl protease